MSIFGKRVKALREVMGLSRNAMAKLIGVDPTQLLRYERGERTPTEAVIRQAAERLNVSADYLLGLTDNPQPWSNDLPESVKKQLERLQELERRYKELQQIVRLLSEKLEDI